MANYIGWMLIFCANIACHIISPKIEELAPKSSCGPNHSIFYNHTPFSYIINETKLCSGEVFLLTYVQSSSINFKRRNMIRETWGSFRFINSQAIRLFFVIGYAKSRDIQIKVNQESDTYRDIVQADFVDSYRNLTLKHIVALHWISNFCSQAKFISKTDDDTFISIFSLVSYLENNIDSNDKMIIGQISSNETPIRRPGFKWTVSTLMFPDETYPPFVKGSAYVISQAAIKPLFVCSYYQKFLFIDDIFITGQVARIADVKLKNFDKYFGRAWIFQNSITTDILESLFFVSQTEYHPKQLKLIWENILRVEL